MGESSLELKPQYLQVAREILQLYESRNLSLPSKGVIGIGGESGSGKSVTASCLVLVMREMGKKVIALHQDNYFHLPPLKNHMQRKQNLEQVGPSEVNMERFQAHVHAFRQGEPSIATPLVDYSNDEFVERQLRLAEAEYLIVEGTYALMLEGLDWKVFMGRNYHETMEARLRRARDLMEPMVEQVLAIEHEIIRPTGDQAQVWVSFDYRPYWKENTK